MNHYTRQTAFEPLSAMSCSARITLKTMTEIIRRLKKDIEEESGASPSFLADLRAYMEAAENLAKNAMVFGNAFHNGCFRVTGWELAAQAEVLLVKPNVESRHGER